MWRLRLGPVTGRRWSTWFAALAGAWILAGWLLVPAIIRSAHGGGLFDFLGGLMGGSSRHAVEVYLGAWAGFAGAALAGLALAWAAGIVLLQQFTWRVARAAYLRVPTIGGRFLRRTVALAAALVSVTVVVQAIHLPDRWETARGHEYERIATSLAGGHGFSFPPGLRWLVLDDEPGGDQHGMTAWKEPVYPYFMAGAFAAFGPHYGKLAIALVQLGLLLVTCLLVYHLGTRLFGPGVGIVAAIATVLRLDLHDLYVIKMQVPAISSLCLVGALLLMLRYADGPSLRRAAWLGLFLGLAALTHAVLVVLVPVAGLFILLHGERRPRRGRMVPALVMGLVAALAISPWTVRNYVQFGHFIPIQTGFGLFANVSNAYMFETYRADFDACGDGSEPLFRSEGPIDAVLTFRDDEIRTNRTHRRAVHCVIARNADVYFSLDEHQRDGLQRQQFLRFASGHPWEFLELTAAKATLYLLDVPVNGRGSVPLAALGLAGMALMARKPRLWVFPVAVLCYGAPFMLGAPMYYRYQAPLEPLYALFAVALLATLFRTPLARLGRAVGNLASSLPRS